jgi:hypothetical protein
MQQYLHVLVVDRRRFAALIQVVGRRWMLPVLACGERARAPLVAARWLADRQLTGVVAGQWVGRIAADGRSIDWLIAIAAGLTVESPPFSWASLDGLEATTAVLDYQAWALDRVVTRGGIAVSGPFGSLDWIDHARGWIESAGLTGLSILTCFRASAHDVVLGMGNGSAEVYFKGAAPDRASGLHAIAAAARTLPESFPRTLALEGDSSSTRCLLEGCVGVPLARSRDHVDAVRVAFDIGRVQQRLVAEPLQSMLNLNDILDDADGLLERAGLPPLSAPTRRAFEDVMSLPRCWTPLDLDPSNVFVGGPQVRYIDLEPRITAMSIALSVFARRLGATGELLQALRRAYESTAGEAVPWQSVDFVTAITEVVTGWRRLLRNVECGEVSGPLDRVKRVAAKRVASAKPLV